MTVSCLLVQTKMYQQLPADLLNLVQTFMVSRGWISESLSPLNELWILNQFHSELLEPCRYPANQLCFHQFWADLIVIKDANLCCYYRYLSADHWKRFYPFDFSRTILHPLFPTCRTWNAPWCCQGSHLKTWYFLVPAAGNRLFRSLNQFICGENALNRYN